MSDEPKPAPPSQREAATDAALEEQRARLAGVPGWPGMLAGTVWALVALGAFLLLLPRVQGEPPLPRSFLLVGGLTGIFSGWVLGVSNALWVLRVSRPGAPATAFLQPMALGFLLKLLVLAGGTLAFAFPFEREGSHVAFAILFAIVTFGFQIVFQFVWGGARQKALAS